MQKIKKSALISIFVTVIIDIIGLGIIIPKIGAERSVVIGPPRMASLFAYFTRKDTTIYLPGAPFILGAVLTGISVVLGRQPFWQAYGNQQMYS